MIRLASGSVNQRNSAAFRSSASTGPTGRENLAQGFYVGHWCQASRGVFVFFPLLLGLRRGFPYRVGIGSQNPSGACPVYEDLIVLCQLLSVPTSWVRSPNAACAASDSGKLGAAPSEGTVRKPNQALGRARSTSSLRANDLKVVNLCISLVSDYFVFSTAPSGITPPSK